MLRLEAAISVVSIAELHFGALESRFPEPLPIDDRVAREWGGLLAAVRQRGAKPRRRHADLTIAATARVHGVPLLTHNIKDFAIVDDLVDVRPVLV